MGQNIIVNNYYITQVSSSNEIANPKRKKKFNWASIFKTLTSIATIVIGFIKKNFLTLLLLIPHC
jgi:hypothetical protein